MAVREGEPPEEERAQALAVVLRAQALVVVPEPVAVRALARAREPVPEKAPEQAPECQDRPPAIAIISVSSPIEPNTGNVSSA